jgi:cytochrome c2
MSFILLKSILACLLLTSAVIAVLSMLSIMGKTEGKKASPKGLKRTHRVSGRIFVLLLLPLLYMGFKFWVRIGDQASIRAVFHAVLALGLIVITLLKVAIVKYYKQFLRFAPVMGILVFCFTFVVFSVTAGYYAVKELAPATPKTEAVQADTSPIIGDTAKGTVYYNTNCLSCHYADSDKKKLGPGLKNLFKKETLPHSGRPATVENVKQQLIKPVLVMPSYSRMTEQEMADLIAYLKTL